MQRYFPNPLAPQHQEIEAVTDPEVLQDLVLKVSLAQNAEEVQQAIDAIKAAHE